MDDLYNQLNGTGDSPNNDEVENDTITNIGSEELEKFNPKQIVGIDHTNQQQVTADAESVTKLLFNYAEVVTAAFRIKKFVPDLNNTPHEKFWRDELMPVIIECISQNDATKSIVIESFEIVKQLAITIKNAGELVQRRKGSTEVTALAQKAISGYFKKLEQCIAEVRKMKADAVYALKNNMGKIFDIIGSEAANFVRAKVQINNAIDFLMDELQQKSKKIALKRGEIEEIHSLMLANEKLVGDEQKDVTDIKNRMEEMKHLNAEADEKINNINKTVPVVEIVKHGFMWWLGLPRVRTVEKLVDRNADRNYYESMILARNQRIREQLNEKEAKAKIFKTLTNERAELTKNFEIVKSELDDLLQAFDKTKLRIEKDIAIEREKLAQLDKSEKNTIAKIGHYGATLVPCLVSIEQFGEKIAHDTGGSPVQPLISMLEGIKAMVELDVELLQSNDPKNVFLAGNRLLEKVNFLQLHSHTGNLAVQKVYDKQLNDQMERLALKQ